MANTDQVKDPVCGMNIDRGVGRKETYEGREYTFCSDACRAQFRQNPQQYTGKRG